MVPTRPSRTAEMVCFMRAAEHARPADARVLDDPYARLFLSPPLRALADTGRFAGRFSPQLSTFVVARHRFIDDALLVALERGVEQVVLLGAGYDSRAWRFSEQLRGRPVFEVDYPATQARKERVLQGARLPDADVRRVPIDFQVDRLHEVLEGAGFRPGRPTFFVWEGVSMYLTREAVKGTITSLAELGGPESRLTADFWQLLDHPPLAGRALNAAARLLWLVGEPVTFGLKPGDAPGFLAGLGWPVADLADARELERRYIRDGRRVYPASFVLEAVRA